MKNLDNSLIRAALLLVATLIITNTKFTGVFAGPAAVEALQESAPSEKDTENKISSHLGKWEVLHIPNPARSYSVEGISKSYHAEGPKHYVIRDDLGKLTTYPESRLGYSVRILEKSGGISEEYIHYTFFKNMAPAAGRGWTMGSVDINGMENIVCLRKTSDSKHPLKITVALNEIPEHKSHKLGVYVEPSNWSVFPEENDGRAGKVYVFFIDRELKPFDAEHFVFLPPLKQSCKVMYIGDQVFCLVPVYDKNKKIISYEILIREDNIRNWFHVKRYLPK